MYCRLQLRCDFLVNNWNKLCVATCPNTFNNIPYNSQNTPLYTYRFATKLVTFVTNGTEIVLFK
jgi:hypothetical protein